MNEEITLSAVQELSGCNEDQPLGIRNPSERAAVAEAMVSLIVEMAGAIVDRPGLVSGSYTLGDDVIALELLVSDEDLGQVIGKQGRTARSMRTILNAVSMRSKQRFSLDIHPQPGTESEEVTEIAPI